MGKSGIVLNSLKVAGAVTGSTITIDTGKVGTIAVGSFVDSSLTAGYNAGTLDDSSTIGLFNVKSKTGGFARSNVIASGFKNVVLTSVDPANGGNKFGFTYHNTLTALRVGAPSFRFDPKGGLIQDMLYSDFEVKKV